MRDSIGVCTAENRAEMSQGSEDARRCKVRSNGAICAPNPRAALACMEFPHRFNLLSRRMESPSIPGSCALKTTFVHTDGQSAAVRETVLKGVADAVHELRLGELRGSVVSIEELEDRIKRLRRAFGALIEKRLNEALQNCVTKASEADRKLQSAMQAISRKFTEEISAVRLFADEKIDDVRQVNTQSASEAKIFDFATKKRIDSLQREVEQNLRSGEREMELLRLKLDEKPSNSAILEQRKQFEAVREIAQQALGKAMELDGLVTLNSAVGVQQQNLHSQMKQIISEGASSNSRIQQLIAKQNVMSEEHFKLAAKVETLNSRLPKSPFLQSNGVRLRKTSEGTVPGTDEGSKHDSDENDAEENLRNVERRRVDARNGSIADGGHEGKVCGKCSDRRSNEGSPVISRGNELREMKSWILALLRKQESRGVNADDQRNSLSVRGTRKVTSNCSRPSVASSTLAAAKSGRKRKSQSSISTSRSFNRALSAPLGARRSSTSSSTTLSGGNRERGRGRGSLGERALSVDFAGISSGGREGQGLELDFDDQDEVDDDDAQDEGDESESISSSIEGYGAARELTKRKSRRGGEKDPEDSGDNLQTLQEIILRKMELQSKHSSWGVLALAAKRTWSLNQRLTERLEAAERECRERISMHGQSVS